MPPVGPYRLVIFDCDGTLVDSQAFIVGCMQDAFRADGLAPPPRLATRWRADLIAGLGKKAEQFILVLDIARVFASDQSLLAAASA